MIEQRRLTPIEIDYLLEQAPDSETRNLKDYLKENRLNAYDFFDEEGCENDGIVVDGVPMYLAVLVKNEDSEFELWTVAKPIDKAQASLYKISKRQLMKWRDKHGPIYATMEKSSPKNLFWTQKMGFRTVYEDNDIIKFKLNGRI